MKINHKNLLNPAAFAQANSQESDNFAPGNSSGEGREKHKHLSRFGPYMTSRLRRRRRAQDAESTEQHNNLDELLIMLEANAKERERPRLMVTFRFEMDQGTAQQQAGKELNPKRPLNQIGAPLDEAARKDIDTIVQAFLDGSSTQTDGPQHARVNLTAVAKSLISLRDTKAQHGVDVSLTHAILSIVRQYLKEDKTTRNIPNTLSEIRDLLVSIAPQGIPAQSLRNYHLKIPLILLNLDRPRKSIHRATACSTISTLQHGATMIRRNQLP
ncbi:hypothetical protein [Uliginosibacterium gangwonense]|uniref:hypothetical protein n=1 Tax=Uliginosibacterium gangwonense TaxID=392736 RepID=UPI000366A454|nr:hypothetical protein [Uliginosibacterium gangwonense]